MAFPSRFDCVTCDGYLVYHPVLHDGSLSLEFLRFNLNVVHRTAATCNNIVNIHLQVNMVPLILSLIIMSPRIQQTASFASLSIE